MLNSMFSSGLSGLNAAQAALATTGHNTANVNTTGYSRQSVQVASVGGVLRAGSPLVGNGVQVSGVVRSYDQYLTTQLNQAESLGNSLSTYATHINRIDNLLANQTASLGPQMQTMFSSLQAVANTPASLPARQQFVGSSQALANQFRSMDQYLTDLNGNINEEVTSSVGQINAYARQLGELNQKISTLGNMAGQAPNDLLDQRDLLVNSLGKLMSVQTVVQDGQVNVSFGKGLSLVQGAKVNELAAVTSASDPSRAAIAAINAEGVAVELQDSQFSGGQLGGLLQFRSEVLSTAQNSLGRMAIALAGSFNAQQKLGVDLDGAVGTDFFSQAKPEVIVSGKNTGNLTLKATFSDTAALTVSDYRLDLKEDMTYSLTRLSDNKAMELTAGFPGSAPANTTVFDGVSLTFAGGVANPGDTFLIQPTRTGGRDFSVVQSDPAKLAAGALPVVAANTSTNQGSGSLSVSAFDPSYFTTTSPLGTAGRVTLTYSSATNKLSGFPSAPSARTYVAGEPLSFNGVTVALKGSPANGDSFIIGKNTGGVSDGRNALLLGALQSKKTMEGGSASFSEAYSQLVSTVGNKARQTDIANTTQTSLTQQIRTAQQSVSGVNLDEETASLLMFQQMYQANAKVIQTASTMFDAVLGISR